MVEKIGPVKNPLTIIAIFAAIAEISGTVVLPFIAAANQAIYVWFLIVFPILLIVLFFLTLNFNHKVLYAPSDYQNEDNFLRSLPRATFAEKVLKIDAEIAEESSVPDASAQPDKPVAPAEVITSAAQGTVHFYQSLVRRSAQASYMLVEELIFRKLSKEFSSEIQREVALGSLGGRYIFDGIVREKGVTTVIEVKSIRHGLMSSTRLRDTLERIQQTVTLLPSEQTANLRVLLAVGINEGTASQERIAAQIEQIRSELSLPIEVRFFNLAELEREFDIGA